MPLDQLSTLRFDVPELFVESVIIKHEHYRETGRADAPIHISESHQRFQ